jgi:hypothetical protein
MRHRGVGFFLLAAAVTFQTRAAESPEEFRKWQAGDATHSREAKFLGFQGGRVRLEGRDGKVMSIDFQELSKDDRSQALSRARVPDRIRALIQLLADSGAKDVASGSPEADWWMDKDHGFTKFTPATFVGNLVGQMDVQIEGRPGWLYFPTWVVDEVWAEDELVVAWNPRLDRLRPQGDTPSRVLLKGADTKSVADGFAIQSHRIWMVAGKRRYPTIAGAERSILVAEPVDLSPYLDPAKYGIKPGDACPRPVIAICAPRRAASDGTGNIVQIVNDREMLVTMKMHLAGEGAAVKAAVVLVRGLDTRKLTEDSGAPPGAYSITGTYKYKSTAGTQRAVFVVEPKGEKP